MAAPNHDIPAAARQEEAPASCETLAGDAAHFEETGAAAATTTAIDDEGSLPPVLLSGFVLYVFVVHLLALVGLRRSWALGRAALRGRFGRPGVEAPRVAGTGADAHPTQDEQQQPEDRHNSDDDQNDGNEDVDQDNGDEAFNYRVEFLTQFSVVDLRRLCRERGVRADGCRPELARRLVLLGVAPVQHFRLVGSFASHAGGAIAPDSLMSAPRAAAEIARHHAAAQRREGRNTD